MIPAAPQVKPKGSKASRRSNYVMVPRPYWNLVMAVMKLNASVLSEDGHGYAYEKMQALRSLALQRKAGKEISREVRSADGNEG